MRELINEIKAKQEERKTAIAALKNRKPKTINELDEKLNELIKILKGETK